MAKPPTGTAKKKGPRLSRRFKRVAAATGLSLAAAGTGFGAVFWTASAPVPLTAHETEVAKSLFGLHYKTDDIRKKYVLPFVGGRLAYPSAMVPLSRHRIYFFRPSLREIPDLTLSSGNNFRLFMHEMTHVWQHRGHWAPVCKTYDYTLTPHARFSDFCNEQQATMAADYAQKFLNPESRIALRLIGDGVPRMKGNEDLARVIENKFPQARYSRERIATHRQRVANCIATYKITFNSASQPDDTEKAAIDRCFNDPSDRAAATTDTPAAPRGLPADRPRNPA